MIAVIYKKKILINKYVPSIINTCSSSVLVYYNLPSSIPNYNDKSLNKNQFRILEILKK